MPAAGVYTMDDLLVTDTRPQSPYTNIPANGQSKSERPTNNNNLYFVPKVRKVHHHAERRK